MTTADEAWMRGEWSAKDMEAARASLRRGELSMTLTATEGERFRLRDIGKLCTHMEALMRSVAKGVNPAAKVEWIVTAVGMAGGNFEITITGQAPRRRRKPAATHPSKEETVVEP